MARAIRFRYRFENEGYAGEARLADGAVSLSLTEDEGVRELRADVRYLDENRIELSFDGRRLRGEALRAGDTLWVSVEGQVYRLIEDTDRRAAGGGAQGAMVARSPMTGTLVKMHAEVGMEMAEGAPLFVVEAMKMEYVVRAPRDVVIAKVVGEAGSQVDLDAELVTFEPPASEAG